MKSPEYRLLHGFKCIDTFRKLWSLRQCWKEVVLLKKSTWFYPMRKEAFLYLSVHIWHYSFTLRLLCTVVILKLYSEVDRLRVWDGEQNIKPGSERFMIYELVLGWVKWPMGPTAKIYRYLHCMCWEHFISNT